jgi:4-aminobutyrate aminotransferase-like enzyme
MANKYFTKNTIPEHAPLVEGFGARVRDIEGTEFLDFSSQTLNLNLGQCHPAVVDAVERQLRTLTYASSRFSSLPSLQLHEKLVSLTPPSLTKVNLSSVTGSLANECAVKAARKVTGEQVVVSRRHSHGGQSSEMMRISGKHWDLTYLGARNTVFIEAPYCFRCPYGQQPQSCQTQCLDQLEWLFEQKHGQIAAVMMEPIMVDAGVLCPPARYHRRVAQMCGHYHVALIWDEVQTAFGWLGTISAMDMYEITPDMVTFGKGLGAGFPLAATVVSEKYDVLNYGEHEFTSGANALSCAASLAMIAFLEQPDVLKDVRNKAALLRQGLVRLQQQYPVIGEVRGAGLLLGVEFVFSCDRAPNSRAAHRMFSSLLANGIITRMSKVGEHTNVLQLKPPLVISVDDLSEFLAKFESAVSEVQILSDMRE